MLNKISRASLILGAFMQHRFGAALAPALGRKIMLVTAKTPGRKPAGNRGMHLPDCNPGFRPMAHGKIGKRSKGLNGCQKRARNRALSAALSLDSQYGNRRAYAAMMSKG
jgi:hypothetical protein